MINLPELPYSLNSLSPHISQQTLDFHYNKHHAGYVKKLNDLISSTDLAKKSLEEIIKNTSQNADMSAVFNNAAQVWNHTFYWRSMSPSPKGLSLQLQKKITEDFGSIENLKKELALAAATQFGSGWAWLLYDKKQKKLSVVKTANASNPLANIDVVPLLVIDVWEHAYYLDYQNRRPDYVAAVLNDLLDWGFASANYSAVSV